MVRPASFVPQLNAAVALSPKKNSGGATMLSFSRGNMQENAEKVQYREHPTRSTEDIESPIHLSAHKVSQTHEDGSDALLKVDAPIHSSPTPENPSTNTSLVRLICTIGEFFSTPLLDLNV